MDNLLFDKYKVRRRFVEVSDADFIHHLRSNKKLTQFISQIDGDIENQKEWIRRYKQREKEKKEFYFIYEDDKGKKFGLNRIYDVVEHSFDFGSWLFDIDTPKGLALLAEIALLDYGFQNLGVAYAVCDIRINNAASRILNERFIGVKKICDDGLNNYYVLSLDTFLKMKANTIKIINNIKI